MMVCLYLAYLILLALLTKHTCRAKNCERASQNVNGKLIWWPGTDSAAVSFPICLDHNLESVQRKCQQGSWEEPPECAFVQDVYPAECPEGFNKFSSLSLLESFCYSVLPHGPFSNSCPYPNEAPFNDYKDILYYIIKDDLIWFPAKREDDDSFGEYYFVEKSSLYGSKVDIEVAYENELVASKQCMVYNHNVLPLVVSCDDFFQRICVYKIIESLNDPNNLCNNQFHDKKCIQTFPGDTINCVCYVQNEVKDRNKFCKKLAEFYHPYQNYLDAILARACWIGLEKNNSKYVWRSIQKEVNYTNWSSETNFMGDYGAIDNTKGWFIYPDVKTLDCALCDETMNFETPILELTYNDNDEIFILKITFYKNLKVLDDIFGYNFYCFVYSGVREIKVRYDEVTLMSKTQIDNYVTEYSFKPYNYGPGYYWCEGFYYPNLERIKSNEEFLHDTKLFGNEYVAAVTLPYAVGVFPLGDTVFFIFQEKMFYYLTNNSIEFIISIRNFKVLQLDEENLKIQYLVHFTSKHTSFLRDEEFQKLNDTVYFAIDAMDGTLDTFTCSNFCFKETLQVNSTSLVWPTTTIGDTSLPIRLCMQTDGVLVTRRCEGDFLYGAHWAPVQSSCSFRVPKSIVTGYLHSLLEDDLPTKLIVQSLLNITETFHDFNYTDIFLIGRILEKVSIDEGVNVSKITSVVSNIMDSDGEVLKNSQLYLNATDRILQNYDKIVDNYNIFGNESYMLVSTKNLILLTVARQANIIGLALFSEKGKFYIEIIYMDTIIKDVLAKSSLEATLFINEKLLQQIGGSSSTQSKKHLSISLFLKDSLFNEDENKPRSVDNVIFGVLLPKLCNKFEAPISIVFKPHLPNDLNKSCSHWQFSSNVSSSTNSRWLESGLINFQNGLVYCEFWHVTNFGLLVINDKNILSDKINLHLLNIISNINSVLSLIRLMVIFVTSLLFKNWRIKLGNQILIHFSFTLFLQIVLSHAAYLVYPYGKFCIIFGATLHYLVIAQFCWTLILGILQFKRLVIVFNDSTRFFLLKACAVGWGVPFVPVIFLLTILPESYQNGEEVCYPSGLGLYLAVLLPISIILIVNLYVFIVILFSIFKKGPQRFGVSKHNFLPQLCMIVLLFFMLGFTWLFGLFAYLDGGVVFMYIFCFLATIQGFMLFLFFIVFNKDTRRMYVVNLFNNSVVHYSCKK